MKEWIKIVKGYAINKYYGIATDDEKEEEIEDINTIILKLIAEIEELEKDNRKLRNGMIDQANKIYYLQRVREAAKALPIERLIVEIGEKGDWEISDAKIKVDNPYKKLILKLQALQQALAAKENNGKNR